MGLGVIFYLSALREGMKIRPKSEETEGNLDGLLKEIGKLNKFAPEGVNELEKEPKQAVRG